MNSHRHSTPSAPPRCPRCGYDLRGFVDTWSDSCPLTGRCSECGLDFEWGKVFADERHPWLFEQRWRWRHQPIRSALITFWKVVRPWRFWREIEMTDDFAPKPAVTWALTFLPFLVSLFVVIDMSVRLFHVLTSPSRYSNGHLLDKFLWYIEVACRSVFEIKSEIAWTTVYALTCGFVYVVLPVSLRRAKVRESHVVRITLYSAFNALFAMIFLHLFFLPHTEFVSRYSSFYRMYVSILNVVLSTIVLVATQYFALRFYLKLPHAFAVSALLTFLAALLTLACFTAWTWAVDGALWLADF